MQPIKRSYTGAGNYIIPLTTYGDAGVSIYATGSITVTAMVDKDNTSSLLTGVTGAVLTDVAVGIITVPADALYVQTAGAVDVTVLQYGT